MGSCQLLTGDVHAEVQNLHLVIHIRVLVHSPLIGSTTISTIRNNDQTPTFSIRLIILSVIERETVKSLHRFNFLIETSIYEAVLVSRH